MGMKQKTTVILIEDNHDLRITVRQLLENGGFDVVRSTNGKDALKILRSGMTPQLILLDLRMPIMSRDDFLDHIDNKEEIVKIPTILVSCDKQKLECFKDYASIVGPLPLRQLPKIIHNYLQ